MNHHGLARSGSEVEPKLANYRSGMKSEIVTPNPDSFHKENIRVKDLPGAVIVCIGIE